MGDPTDIGALTLAVGEMRGQMREMIHAQNNIAQKVDFLTERALLAPTSAQIEALSKRVDALEAEKDRQDGAKGMVASILGSKAFGVAVSIIFAAYVSIKEGLFK